MIDVRSSDEVQYLRTGEVVRVRRVIRSSGTVVAFVVAFPSGMGDVIEVTVGIGDVGSRWVVLSRTGGRVAKTTA